MHGGGGEKIEAAHDMGDALQGVVHHDAETMGSVGVSRRARIASPQSCEARFDLIQDGGIVG